MTRHRPYQGERHREAWERTQPDPEPEPAPTCRWCDQPPAPKATLYLLQRDGSYCCTQACVREEREARKARIVFSHVGGEHRWSIEWRCPRCETKLRHLDPHAPDAAAGPPAELVDMFNNPRPWISPANCDGCARRRREAEREHAGRAR